LEASRAAGLESVRNASCLLQEGYSRRSDDLKKRHEGVMHTIKARKSEQEETLAQSTENLSRMNAALKEKCSRIEELEKRVQRMDEEKKTLKEKQRLLKGKLQQMMLKAEDTNSCVKVQTEISTLQEQISHLDRVIHSQHQNLHALIHQTEDLNNELRLQDERIESLKEQIGTLQATNEELKYRVQFWSAQSKSRVSKAVSANPILKPSAWEQLFFHNMLVQACGRTDGSPGRPFRWKEQRPMWRRTWKDGQEVVEEEEAALFFIYLETRDYSSAAVSTDDGNVLLSGLIQPYAAAIHGDMHPAIPINEGVKKLDTSPEYDSLAFVPTWLYVAVD
ncbi:UNVERIFIED_CONTAM: hypothetical protein K2H54_066769, partial [Gekko kuhli]